MFPFVANAERRGRRYLYTMLQWVHPKQVVLQQRLCAAASTALPRVRATDRKITINLNLDS